MAINNRYNMMQQAALRTGLSLFMLFGVTTAFAQTDATADQSEAEATAKKPKKQAALPQYQMKEVTGTVYDAGSRQPLAGVRVQALANKYYTAMTDAQGHYTIKVPEHVTALYVSTEGYNAVQVGLHGNTAPDAYVYSTNLKALYTDGTNILNYANYAPETSSAISVESEIENSLNAAVRTVNRGGMPAQGAAMFVNGINSLNTNAQPLVVIDGVVWDMQYDRGTIHDGFFNNIFNLIDPEDVENIEVLRNGTALYGAQGGNGVIRITTKRGHSMATRINIRAWGGYELTPDQIPVMNAGQYRNYLAEFLGTTKYAISNDLGSNTKIPFFNEDPNYLYYKQYHNETDWQKDLYNNAFTQNYRVSVQGGDDVAMYNLSLGFAQADATAKNNDFNRLNIRFNTDVNLWRGFTAGLDMAYVRNAYNLRDNGWAESYAMKNISSPNVLGLIQSPFIDPYAYFVRYLGNNQLTLEHTDKTLAGMNYTESTNPFLFAQAFGYEGLANPYWILKNGQGDNKNYQEQTQFLLNVAPKYKPNRYITITDRFSYILNRANEKYFMPQNGTPVKAVENLGDVQSVIASQFAKESMIANDFSVDWHRNFGKHDIDIFGGFRYNRFGYSNSNVRGYNNSNDKMPNLAYSLQYLSYGGTNDTWTNLSYYLNADYNFKNRYFAKFIMSADASSRFGKEAKSGVQLAGVAWGLFPSLQAGWVLSNEEWFKCSWVDHLQLTAGYEMSGNDNIDYYAARTYFENIKFLDRATSLELSNIQNPAIQWETNHRMNVALNANLFHNRLSLGVEYFNAKTTDLLVRKTVSDITGLSQMWSNDGELTNTGFNANINAVLVNTKNWQWQLGATLGRYVNEITKLPETENNTLKMYSLDANGQRDQLSTIHGYTSSIYGQDNILTAVGHSAGVFYGYETDGVYATTADAQAAGLKYPTGLSSKPSRDFKAGDVKFVDQNGDGWINEADKVVIGNPNPDFYGNIYTSLSWKNLTLNVNLKYSVGGDIYNYQRSQLESANNIWNQTTAVVNRWKTEGDITSVPRTISPDSEEWVNNERFSDRWIEDGSYLKLKNVRLTYKVPVNLSWLLGLSVWGEANNVVTLTKYLGQDPEVSCSNSVLYQGIDTGFLPSGRCFNLGVTINL
ncbi:MAG: SusC/RagA family TonB-linked outer membrane protein [Bacteroidales bacterium]|nr:SusC/RagA family TonB-linked outer membrane protein [Bacteroidales bacterium]